jgi:hypothetical protein
LKIKKKSERRNAEEQLQRGADRFMLEQAELGKSLSEI